LILYENQIFSVSNGWIRGLRVHDKSSGSTIKPDAALSTQCTAIWFHIKRKTSATAKLVTNPNAQKEIGRIAERLVFHDFGCTLLRIETKAQAATFDGPPDQSAEYYLDLAHEAYAQRGPSQTHI
jgi:hypothetical protein